MAVETTNQIAGFAHLRMVCPETLYSVARIVCCEVAGRDSLAFRCFSRSRLAMYIAPDRTQ